MGWRRGYEGVFLRILFSAFPKVFYKSLFRLSPLAAQSVPSAADYCGEVDWAFWPSFWEFVVPSLPPSSLSVALGLLCGYGACVNMPLPSGSRRLWRCQDSYSFFLQYSLHLQSLLTNSPPALAYEVWRSSLRSWSYWRLCICLAPASSALSTSPFCHTASRCPFGWKLQKCQGNRLESKLEPRSSWCPSWLDGCRDVGQMRSSFFQRIHGTFGKARLSKLSSFRLVLAQISYFHVLSYRRWALLHLKKKKLKIQSLRSLNAVSLPE